MNDDKQYEVVTRFELEVISVTKRELSTLETFRFNQNNLPDEIMYSYTGKNEEECVKKLVKDLMVKNLDYKISRLSWDKRELSYLRNNVLTSVTFAVSTFKCLKEKES